MKGDKYVTTMDPGATEESHSVGYYITASHTETDEHGREIRVIDGLEPASFDDRPTPAMVLCAECGRELEARAVYDSARLLTVARVEPCRTCYWTWLAARDVEAAHDA